MKRFSTLQSPFFISLKLEELGGKGYDFFFFSSKEVIESTTSDIIEW